MDKSRPVVRNREAMRERKRNGVSLRRKGGEERSNQYRVPQKGTVWSHVEQSVQKRRSGNMRSSRFKGMVMDRDWNKAILLPSVKACSYQSVALFY